MNLLRRLVKTFTSTPVVPGSKWGYQHDKGNPWARWVMEVEEVQNGWVRYRATTPHDGYRGSECREDPVEFFRAAHHLLSDPS